MTDKIVIKKEPEVRQIVTQGPAVIVSAPEHRIVRQEVPTVLLKKETATRIIKIGTVAVSFGDASPSSVIVPFALADWEDIGAGQYAVDLLHNLASENAVLIRLQSGTATVNAQWENYTTEKIRVLVPADPDCRFAGTATILKI